jgi:hypothetical protein
VVDKEKYANWIIRYETLQPQHDVLEKEIKTAYAEAVAKIVPLLNKTVQLNAEISKLIQSKPSREWGNDDGRWLTAISTPKELVLPNPDKPSVMLWPPAPPQNYIDTSPIIASPSDKWWETQQAEAARRRIEDVKRADAVHEEEGRIANNPALWRRG